MCHACQGRTEDAKGVDVRRLGHEAVPEHFRGSVGHRAHLVSHGNGRAGALQQP